MAEEKKLKSGIFEIVGSLPAMKPNRQLARAHLIHLALLLHAVFGYCLLLLINQLIRAKLWSKHFFLNKHSNKNKLK